MKRKLLCLILVFSFTIPLLSVFDLSVLEIPAYAEGEQATSGTTGDCTWKLDGTKLTVSGNGAMEDYDYDSGPWGETITEVVIEEGVTSIGEYAFYCCEALTSVTLPDSVTVIGSGAFSGCEALTAIVIPDSVRVLGPSAFKGCTVLASVTISNGVKAIPDYAFSGCKSLTSVSIPQGVLTIGDDAFSSCESLESVQIPNTVTYIGSYAFTRSGVKELVIPGSVKILSYGAFTRCPNLTSVVMEDGVNVLENYVFSECSALTIVTAPDSLYMIDSSVFSFTPWWDAQPEGVVYLGKVAYGIKGECPASVELKEGTVGIAGSAFYNCESLTSVSVPDSVIAVGSYAFSGTGWWNAHADQEVIYAGKVACGIKDSFSCPESIVLKEGTVGIAAHAFSECFNLKSITIPDSVTNIGPSAFFWCGALESITVPEGVTYIGTGTFYWCSTMKSVDLPDSLRYIGSEGFYGCYEIEDLQLPSQLQYVGSSAFAHCSEFSSINFPKTLVSVGNYAFSSGNLTDAWYEGSQEDFATSCFSAMGNDELRQITWHYNSCMKNPADEKVHVYDGADDAICNLCQNVAQTLGDLDGNPGVDMDDAIYLLFHCSFADEYPIDQSADFDNSGEVDMDDAIYLLFHCSFPDEYPLNP